MSVQAMAWALDHRQTGALPAEVRLVLVSLADYTDPTGRNAWPAAPTLAHRLGITTRSVRRSLALLEDNGLIRRGDQTTVAHIRADRRPIVWDLALDGIQVLLRFTGPDGSPVAGTEVDLAHEPYDRDRHGVTPVSPREAVDNPPRGDAHDRHGVTRTSPNPNTDPSPHSPSVLKVTTVARSASAPQAAPVDPTAPIRGLGLTDTNCPTCGVRVYRNHRCRSSALTPVDPGNADTVRAALAASPAPPPAQLTLDLLEAPRGICDWCHQPGILNDVGVCRRCHVRHASMGPHPHPLEDERP